MDALGNTIATRSSDGQWSITLYDAEQRSVFSHQPSGDWTTTEYDESGLVTKSTHHPATGANETTEYKYDANGRQIEVLKDGKSISRTEYTVSSSGARSVAQIDQNGNKSITETDSAGRTVREAFVGIYGAHRETVYGYDTDGRRNYVLSPNGLETWTTFDASGREIETKTRAAGRDYITRKGYDRFGRLVWSQDPQQALDTQNPIFTTYLYITDKNHTATAWTSADDCTGVTDPRYGQLAIVFHADGNQDPTDNTGFLTDSKSFEMYAYDSQGRQTDVVKPASLSETDAAITTTTTTYDEKGRVAAVIMNHRNGATTDSQTNLKFVFHYDAHGNRSEVVYPSGVVKQWNYKYNSNDELTSMTETQVGPVGAPAPWKTTLYDPTTGLSTSLIDAVGNVITSSYDTNQQLVSKHYYTGEAPQRVVNYWYDAESGQLKELKKLAAEGTPAEGLYGETRSYDAETGGLAEVGKSIDGKGIGKLSYAYNNTGALASISWLGRSVSYDYDEFGRMKSAHANEGDWEYTYAPCGKKDSVRNTRANELETREYDGLGRLKSIEHRNVNENRIIFGIDYRLGPDGNRVGAFERRQTATDDVVTSWSYTYDPLGRLARERRSIDSHYNGSSANYALDRDVSYQYDEDSNRRELIDHRNYANSESYTYVANTQRLAKVSYSSTKYTNYSWTENGEMAREDIYDNSTLTVSKIYTWGIGGTLIGVRFEGGDQDGCKVNYEYDTDNELIGRKVTLKNGTVTENERYLVDHQNPTGYSQRLAVLGLNGSIRHEIFTDELAAETAVSSGSSNTQYPHADGLGSIRALTGKSSSGQTLGTDAERDFYDYTAFGSRFLQNNTFSYYAFSGQAKEYLTNTQYHRARWLKPETSLWLSVDAEFDFPGNLGSTCGYGRIWTLNSTDPTGHFTLMDAVITVSNVSLLVRIALWVTEYVQKAWGIRLIDDCYIEALRNILDTVDLITLPFNIVNIGSSLGKLWTKFGGTSKAGAICNEIRAGEQAACSVASAGTGAQGAGQLLAKMIRYIPRLGELPEDLYGVIAQMNKYVQEARALFVARNWTELEALYGQLPHVRAFLRMLRDPATPFWRLRMQAGNAIHQIAFSKMTKLRDTFKQIVSINEALAGIEGRPDFVLRAANGVNYVIDVTSAASAGKAAAVYEKSVEVEKAVDLLYDAFKGMADFR